MQTDDYKAAIAKLTDSENLAYLLFHMCQMALDSQSWDGNDPNDDNWTILYKGLREVTKLYKQHILESERRNIS